jgi:ABC-type polysaccharide/polyol phosphate transport system ATPase subunit
MPSFRRKQDAGYSSGVELFLNIIWQLSRVCTRGIVMEHGKIVYDGEIVNAVSLFS